MGKTRDLFKKIRDTNGTFHAKMGSINDRNCMGLTEAEDIKKRWQEYTEELYEKDLHDPDNHDGVITHLEPDILECEVKWALESITMNKASGADGIPIELFQILKDDAVKVLHSICQQIWKTQQWSQDWKRSVFIPILKKEFIGPGLHLRPVRADPARPPLQWTLNSAQCLWEQWKDKTPSGQGNLEDRIQVTHHLRENRH